MREVRPTDLTRMLFRILAADRALETASTTEGYRKWERIKHRRVIAHFKLVEALVRRMENIHDDCLRNAGSLAGVVLDTAKVDMVNILRSFNVDGSVRQRVHDHFDSRIRQVRRLHGFRD